jgi:hypothetical protein
MTPFWLAAAFLQLAFLLLRMTCPCAAARADESVPNNPAWRLELATGPHEGVVPVSVDRDRSTWQAAAGQPDPGSLAEVSTSEIVRWGRCPPWPQGPMVLLADGGLIAGHIETLDANTCVITSTTFGRIELPAVAVRGYRASVATGPVSLEPTAREARSRLPASRLSRPAEPRQALGVLLLANRDRVAASTIRWQADVLTVETTAGTVLIPQASVQAIDFGSPILPSPTVATAVHGQSQRILVAIVDGSRFTIQQLQPTMTGAAPTPQAQTALNQTALNQTSLTLTGMSDRDRPLVVSCVSDDIVALAVDDGSARLLALHEASAATHAPECGSLWPLARGHTLTGDWPSLRGETAFTALGIHAAARVRYRLPRPADRFEATVAIDDSAGQGGSVVVKVRTRPADAGNAGNAGNTGTDRNDGFALDTPDPPDASKREVFVSPVLRGGDDPIVIRAPLDKATDLELVVETADGADILDRTLWLDPRVITTPE